MLDTTGVILEREMTGAVLDTIGAAGISVVIGAFDTCAAGAFDGIAGDAGAVRGGVGCTVGVPVGCSGPKVT